MGNPDNQRLMVVGAGSFLASQFFRHSTFTDFENVVVVGRKGSPRHEKVKNIELIDGDTDQLKALIGDVRPSHLLNLAGTTCGSSEAQIDVNTALPCSILDAVAESCPECRVVLIGSAAEYGIPTAEVINEEHPLNPASFYGLTKKWQSEAALLKKRSGIDVVVARIFNLLGPGLKEHLAFGSFVSQIRSSKGDQVCLKIGNLNVSRDFLDVRDAVKAIDGLLSKQKLDSTIYNLCSGKAENLGELLKELINFSGKNVVIEKDASRYRANDVETITGSYSLLNEETGWSPQYRASDAIKAMWSES